MFLNGCVLLYLFSTLYVAASVKILTILPYICIEQHGFIFPYLKALTEREHELTIISAFRPAEPLKNTHVIQVYRLHHILNETRDADYSLPYTKWQEAGTIAQYFFTISLAVLEDKSVQDLLHSNVHFDLIILEAAHLDALFGFAQHFEAPIIGISAYGSAWNIDHLVGNVAPSVHEPMSPTGFAPGQNLIERLQNWIFIVEEKLIHQSMFIPRQTYLYKKFFTNAQMPLSKLKDYISLVLINQHFTLGRPRSNVPNLIEVAGMHIPKHTKSLPDRLATFVNNAEHGVIYFSLGNDIMTKYLPQSILDKVLETLQNLKQHVIWKFESERLPNITENIYMDKWLPQMDILAHPNVKLMITHAGLLSLTEAVYYGKPVLGLPFFFDQFNNIARMEKLGIALSLDVFTQSSKEITAAINELLSNQSYRQNAKSLSERFRDQPMSPLQTAIWWTEYVIRHKGAQYMRVDEESFDFVSYYDVDTLAVILFRLGITLTVVIFVVRKILKILWNKYYLVEK